MLLLLDDENTRQVNTLMPAQIPPSLDQRNHFSQRLSGSGIEPLRLGLIFLQTTSQTMQKRHTIRDNIGYSCFIMVSIGV